MRAIAIVTVMLSLGCGAAPPTVVAPDPMPTATPIPARRFAGHGPIVLRSQSAETQPPFYAELAQDGEVTGARCGATRLTDDGVLERDGTAVAHVESDDTGLVVADRGWRVADATLVTGGESRFVLAGGVITPSDAELPAIAVDPPDAPPALVLALFATLLVCDDVGP